MALSLACLHKIGLQFSHLISKRDALSIHKQFDGNKEKTNGTKIKWSARTIA